MRKITQEEAKEWMGLARDYGFVNESGDVALGRFIIESVEDGRFTLMFVTPLVAGLYSHEDLERKQPPIMFDRTPDGEIIIPGRWWADMFEMVGEDPGIPESVRETAFDFSRKIECPDALLLPDTDTIEFLAPGQDGQLVVHEALPPGCMITMSYESKTPGG